MHKFKTIYLQVKLKNKRFKIYSIIQQLFFLSLETSSILLYSLKLSTFITSIKLFLVILSINVTFCLPACVIGLPNLSTLFGKKYKSILFLVLILNLIFQYFYCYLFYYHQSL